MPTTVPSAVKKFESCAKVAGNFSVPPPPSYFANKTYSVRNVALHPSSSYKPANVNMMNRFAGNATSSNFNCFPGKTTNNIAQTLGQTLRNCDNGAHERINSSPYCARRPSHHRAENENGNSVDNLGASSRSRVVKYDTRILNRTENDDDDSCRDIAKSNAVPSRHSSVSSLSEEGSLISTEEWSLLELCITSGMPRNKYAVKGVKGANEGAISGSHDECEPIPEDNYSVCSYNSYVCKTWLSAVVRAMIELSTTWYRLLKICILLYMLINKDTFMGSKRSIKLNVSLWVKAEFCFPRASCDLSDFIYIIVK